MQEFVVVIALLSSALIGMSKSGLKGIGTVGVAILASLYGAKASTGIVLPMLLVGDIWAVWYYNRYCKMNYLFKFLPAMVVGVLIAVFVGKNLPEQLFKQSMGIIILISVAIMWWRERDPTSKFPSHWWFAGSMGVTAGFTTMIGNLAGAFVNIFFLATRLPKNEFIATAAWLFLIINIFKMPFHIWVWKTVTIDTMKTSGLLTIGLLIGFFIGLKLVDRIQETTYRKFILIVTALSAVFIFIK